MRTLLEPVKALPVIDEVDICVLGGSCTGVFAAVRAARLGARVAVVEKQNCFGGVATSGMVNIWHSRLNTDGTREIIGGLTRETTERLKPRGAVRVVGNECVGVELNTEELKIELDELVREAGVIPFLHTMYCAPWLEDGKLAGIIVENKSGRGVILARYFIDATGDGDLCHHLGLATYTRDKLQPPTTCARLYGMRHYQGFDIQCNIREHREEFGLPEDWGWAAGIPGMPELSMHAETHVFDVNCAVGQQLTYAEMEGRRQVRAVMDIIRKYGTSDQPIALASYIGIRETRHVRCQHCVTQDDVLYGTRFPDAIAQGSYRVDVHQSDRPGIVFRYLDGREEYMRVGFPTETGRWRTDPGPYPTFYQIPFRALLPADQRHGNLLIAGRMLDADEGAYGALRVMVNMNQTGEAAGVAAYLALSAGATVGQIDTLLLRKTLQDGGSIII